MTKTGKKFTDAAVNEAISLLMDLPPEQVIDLMTGEIEDIVKDIEDNA